jgi:hypothetical protein
MSLALSLNGTCIQDPDAIIKKSPTTEKYWIIDQASLTPAFTICCIKLPKVASSFNKKELHYGYAKHYPTHGR